MGHKGSTFPGIEEESIRRALRTRGMDPNLDFAEAAVFLGCQKSTLRVWVSRRQVPFVKVGKLTRFRRKDLEAWLEERAVRPAGSGDPEGPERP